VDQDGVPYFIDDQHIRASMIKTARFRFLDDVAGIRKQLSTATAPVNSLKYWPLQAAISCALCDFDMHANIDLADQLFA
jgi:hypothetical protein